MKIKLFTIPNAITLLNLGAGCIAIYHAAFNRLETAFCFIVLAAIFDFFDGFAARMLKSYSEVGKELDSLADMVSFGVAPAFVLLSMFRVSAAGVDYDSVRFLVFVVAMFSALRLAKFNIDERQSTEFVGLPTPANAILLSSIGALAARGNNLISVFFVEYPWAIFVIAAVSSWLLVSEIRMFSFKFKTFGFAENRLRYIFALCTVIAVATMGMFAIPAVIAAYIVVSVVTHSAKGDA